MSLISAWSLTRLLLVCFGWGLVSSFFLVLWPFMTSIQLAQSSPHESGVGAIGVSVLSLLVRLAIIIVPPVVLFLIWLAARAK